MVASANKRHEAQVGRFENLGHNICSTREASEHMNFHLTKLDSLAANLDLRVFSSKVLSKSVLELRTYLTCLCSQINPSFIRLYCTHL